MQSLGQQYPILSRINVVNFKVRKIIATSTTLSDGMNVLGEGSLKDHVRQSTQYLVAFGFGNDMRCIAVLGRLLRDNAELAITFNNVFTEIVSALRLCRGRDSII